MLTNPPAFKLSPNDGFSKAPWIDSEFGAVPLHRALKKRGITSIKIQSMASSKTFASAAGSDEAAIIGYYQMMDILDEDVFTP
ncbi:MAG: hypothetical protein OXC62_16270 [Aestuariivita sp.]|nr:hypothetical protein [Aestuariivita sp.]